MELRRILSKERLSDFIKSVKKLQPRINHSSLLVIATLSLMLFIAFAIRIFPLYWEIQIGKIHLSEFDPYFQFRFANHVVENGFISWVHPEPGWIDMQRWYPQGYHTANNKKPALPLTAAAHKE